MFLGIRRYPQVSGGIRRYPQVSGRDPEGFGGIRRDSECFRVFSPKRVFLGIRIPDPGIRRDSEGFGGIRRDPVSEGSGFRRDPGFGGIQDSEVFRNPQIDIQVAV